MSLHMARQGQKKSLRQRVELEALHRVQLPPANPDAQRRLPVVGQKLVEEGGILINPKLMPAPPGGESRVKGWGEFQVSPLELYHWWTGTTNLLANGQRIQDFWNGLVIADAYHGLERHGRPGMPARTSKENPLLSKSNAMIAFIHIKASDFIVITPPTTAVNVNEGTSDGGKRFSCVLSGKVLGQVEILSWSVNQSDLDVSLSNQATMTSQLEPSWRSRPPLKSVYSSDDEKSSRHPCSLNS